MRQQSIIALGLSMLVAHVASQNSSAPFSIDPNEVDPSLRSSWCSNEYDTCKRLCDNAPTADDCDPGTLVFHCLCQNGSAPALGLYTQTMPTFICQQAFKDCNAAAAITGNKTAQDDCTKNIQDNCGKLDPATYTPGSGSSSGGSSSSSSAAPTTTGTGTSPAGAPSTSSAASAATNAPSTTSSHAAAPTLAVLGNGVAALAAAGLLAVLV